MDTNFGTFLAVMKLLKKSNPILAVTELGEKVNYLVLDTLDFCLGSVMFMVG